MIIYYLDQKESKKVTLTKVNEWIKDEDVQKVFLFLPFLQKLIQTIIFYR